MHKFVNYLFGSDATNPSEPSTSQTQAHRPCNHPYCETQSQSYCFKLRGRQALTGNQGVKMTEWQTAYLTRSKIEQSTFYWDPQHGWVLVCTFCPYQRCEECELQLCTSITHFQDCLTFENQTLWRCALCEHQRCAGTKLKMVSTCQYCEHVACEVCLEKGVEKKRPFCCACEEVVPAGWIEKTKPVVTHEKIWGDGPVLESSRRLSTSTTMFRESDDRDSD